MMWQDIDDLEQEEYDSVWEFSQDTSNLANDLDPKLLPNDENVDLSICKMIMDGAIEIESLSDSIH